MALKPRTNTDPMYRLLLEGGFSEFNDRKAKGEQTDLTNCDFRNVSLVSLDAKGLDFSGCYFRQADLRGIDFSESNLLGCSLHGAKISGVLFPMEISAEEIALSLLHGIRVRYRT